LTAGGVKHKKMIMIKYIWAKILKKMRGSAIKTSQIHVSSKVEYGSLSNDPEAFLKELNL